ncbi:MAG TPA: hypothetical protein VEQ37_17575 [Actinomycetota bacterium]|nr:hypothetical protein [Actinomycetota bacterium]
MIGRVTRSRALMVLGLGAAVLLIAAAASVAARPSSAPSLPPTSSDRLIASTLRALARDPSVSGHLTAHLDFGLPSIPNEGPGAAASKAAGFLASLTGSHRLRLWSSADGFRLADLLEASERAVFVSRTDAWAWDFSSFTAYHLGRIPQGHRGSAHEGDRPGIDFVDPLALTRRALDAIKPSTRVAVTGTTRVAGRDAYVLRLEPRTPATLVGRIEIAVDSERRVPLRVAVIPRGRRGAAISVAFTSISFASIKRSVYSFTPPPGAKVRDVSRELGGKEGTEQGTRGSEREEYGPGDFPRLLGHDWTTVIALRTPPLATLRGAGEGFDPAALLPLSGPLLSVRLVDRTDHGWLVYGLVPQSALVLAARELP